MCIHNFFTVHQHTQPHLKSELTTTVKEIELKNAEGHTARLKVSLKSQNHHKKKKTVEIIELKNTDRVKEHRGSRSVKAGLKPTISALVRLLCKHYVKPQ